MGYDLYLGDNAAKVYAFAATNKGDGGQNITTQYVTKRLDFSDQIPEALGYWITVHSIKLVYVDQGQASVTVSISVDGGTSWTDSSATTIGTAGADKKVKSKTFYFTKLGQFFNIKVTHTSSTAIFQFIELHAEIEIGGEHFDL